MHAPYRQSSLASFSVSSGDSGDAAAARDCEDCDAAAPLSSSSSVDRRFLGGIGARAATAFGAKFGVRKPRDALPSKTLEVDARSKRRIINHLTQLDLVELIGTLTKPCNIELMPARAAPPFPQPPLRTPSPPHWLIRCSTTTSKTRSPQSASGQCFGPQYNQPGS